MEKHLNVAAFAAELETAGLKGIALSFGDDGKLVFGSTVTTQQRTAIMQVYEAHDADAADLLQARSAACARIDAAAFAKRLAFMTAGPAQDYVYLTKAAQAASYKTAGYIGSVPALVAAEAAASSRTARQAADAIIAAEAASAQSMAAIEEQRRRGKIAVGAAQSIDNVTTAQHAAVEALGAL